MAPKRLKFLYIAYIIFSTQIKTGSVNSRGCDCKQISTFPKAELEQAIKEPNYTEGYCILFLIWTTPYCKRAELLFYEKTNLNKIIDKQYSHSKVKECFLGVYFLQTVIIKSGKNAVKN